MEETWSKGMELRYCRTSGMGDKVALFNQKSNDHSGKQAANPFSASFKGSTSKPHYSKDDPNYGRPVQGSKTEHRGIKAHCLINSEILLLCDMIYENGEQYEDGTAAILFGELFQIYTRISSKVVGILLRARKHGLADFEGEILFQRRDDNVPIILTKPIKEIRAIYKEQKEIEYAVEFGATSAPDTDTHTIPTSEVVE